MTITTRRLWWITALLGTAVLAVIVGLLTRSPSESAAAEAPSAPAATSPIATSDTSPAPTAVPTGSASAPEWAAGLSVLAPVPLDAPAEFGTGVTAEIESATQVDGVGRLPGERSGPAVALTVRLHNGTDAVISLDDIVVDLYGEDGRVGPTLSQDPHSSSMNGTLAPGDSLSGTYVRLLPDPTSAQVTITVSYVGAIPAAVFEGSVTP